MPTAYVLINTEPEKMEEVAKEIGKIEGVVEASMVYGVHDIVAKIQTETMEKVSSQIRRMASVRGTQTMIVIESQ